MSSLKIEERFTIDAPAEEVWRFLIDPERVVVCLPGAQLDSTDDDGAYHGMVKVRVGAVTVQYKGSMTFEELDHERRFVRMVGKGKEKGGAGSVMMTMESTVRELDGGGAEVTVESTVQLAGKIVRFGRGMIEIVSKEIFKQFTACLTEKLAGPVPGGGTGAGTEGGQGTGEGDAATPKDGAETPGAPAEAQAVAALPLLFRALRSWLLNLFGRG
ncbi:MAG: SRPBCC family protein [Longimicrobiales bacterium]